jgi:hypothetical protein
MWEAGEQAPELQHGLNGQILSEPPVCILLLFLPSLSHHTVCLHIIVDITQFTMKEAF